MNFVEIQDEIKRRLADVTAETLISVKLAINTAYQELWTMTNWWFARRRGRLQLIAPYNTGSISVTEDSDAVTGSGTSWTADMIGRKLRLGEDQIVYEITNVVNSTSLTIETGYKGSTGSGKSYGIYKDTFALADRATRNFIMWQRLSPARIYEWDSREFRELKPSPYCPGIPKRYALIGQTTDAYYKTGTVAATADLVDIIGTNTAWTSAMTGRLMKIQGNDDEYTIVSAGVSALKLDIGYTGTTGASKAYEISPAGIEQIQFADKLPDRAMQVEYNYFFRPLKLVSDGHVPKIPQQWHYLLVLGGYYRVLPERGLSLGLLRMAEKDYYRAIAEIKKYHYASQDRVPTFKDNFREQAWIDTEYFRIFEEEVY